MRLFLVSNSTPYQGRYLEHVAPELLEFLGSGIRRVLFVPYAAQDRDAYTRRVRARFEELGLGLDSVHETSGADGPRRAVDAAEAVFVGGGNTFRLLAEMHARGLVGAIRARALAEMPYLGASAGTNVACPTIKTTNDMPIVEPPTFAALGLVPFQVNPHYLDAPSASTHMGETREDRIREFHEENDVPVVGLREGAWLRVEGATMTLRGSTRVRLFRKSLPPEEHPPGSRLDFLLA